jgi:hypothetical protein
MPEASLGQKILWFFYEKGMGGVKPDFLFLAKFADRDWFRVAETLMKDNNLEGRQIILDQLLQPKILKSHPKRTPFLRMLGQFLSKGFLDERREVVKFIDEHIDLISTRDEALYGPLMTAQRDSDTVISLAAESAVQKLRGETP